MDGTDLRYSKAPKTLSERGLDFLDAARMFEGETFTMDDVRFDYGEPRHVTYGLLDDRAAAVVWTEREGMRRIVSMRYAHGKEVEHVRHGRS